MELELQWDGNPSIILDIRTRLGVALPVQVIQIILFAPDVLYWLFGPFEMIHTPQCKI